MPSGVVVDVVTESEMESLTLDKYGVIFLCNVYRLGDKTDDNLKKVRKWVEAGGGLVIMDDGAASFCRPNCVFSGHFQDAGEREMHSLEGLHPADPERLRALLEGRDQFTGCLVPPAPRSDAPMEHFLQLVRTT